MAGTAKFGIAAALVLGVALVGTYVFAVAPHRQPAAVWAATTTPDLTNGKRMFFAGGCSSCHAAPGATGDARLLLTGGVALKTQFGTFHVPNISPDPKAGIGEWTLAEFGDAVTRGIGPSGENLYPAFPYTSYARMKPQDVADLYGYLKTLPVSGNVAPPHELGFPFNQRLALTGWKLLFLNDKPRVTLASADAQIQRGQYLVEGPGHCGECHTPRNVIGGLKADEWLAGGPNPEGEGRIPDITPGSDSMGKWSKDEIASYLETGFTPDFDSVGGSMVEVQKNLAELPAEDRAAIAAYLKAIPAK
ncbi:c-type cytochrome [Agrobacterium vitis]|uniref:Diacylglycerol kinase n=1 Tax=Agrobacterium vitis TaxID=373 RepID=A0A368P0A7_AGRVI|nr:cytochrome c [Agrobacterium vitis]KAA3520019.1 diacylglycerol kinase [Agrobacterium vitis]KAA3532082.1 diacylglycerol kinase [Agrobacterium vitis]MCF1475859.1 c-type cytochrome [Agrobacterium vitis]MUZ97083.1 c-type cytochrome [Agrobacterium vitis]MVA32027.1 c-type cytochrome [Agrobacterium vitis]